MHPDSMRTRLANVPAVLYFKKSAVHAGKKGTILFYHGLLSNKDANAKELLSLASHGFLAVGLDNIGHGERRFPDYDDYFTSRNDDFPSRFIKAVQDTVNEIPAIIDEIIARGFAEEDKIGITGISMGGFITYGAVLADRRIKAAAPILGNPRWNDAGEKSPHRCADRFYPTALLAQNAGDDEHVPPRFAREFHEQLLPYYAEMPARVKYVEFPREHHFMSEGSWNELWHNTLQWFEEFLR
jgi:uncharacterized protein